MTHSMPKILFAIVDKVSHTKFVIRNYPTFIYFLLTKVFVPQFFCPQHGKLAFSLINGTSMKKKNHFKNIKLYDVDVRFDIYSHLPDSH